MLPDPRYSDAIQDQNWAALWRRLLQPIDADPTPPSPPESSESDDEPATEAA